MTDGVWVDEEGNSVNRSPFFLIQGETTLHFSPSDVLIIKSMRENLKIKT